MTPNPYLLLELQDYDRHYRNVNVRNDGHTVYITLDKQSERPTVSLTESPRNYRTFVFEQMHFHWGDDNSKGSEHSVDNDFASAEIHFVHFNKKYGTLAKARDRSDGLLVLTVLLSLSREDNIALHPIIKVLPQIIKFNSTSIINGLNFDKLMPRHKSKFFKYSGSLTTPPCSESVTFVILSDPIRISAIQLSQFRRLLESPKSGQSTRIFSNTRGVQRRHGREIEVSVPNRRRGRAFGESFIEERGADNNIGSDY